MRKKYCFKELVSVKYLSNKKIRGKDNMQKILLLGEIQGQKCIRRTPFLKTSI
jgi:hypothetical protein